MTQPARIAIITDLHEWEIDEGKALPMNPVDIARLEQVNEMVDLETGEVRRVTPVAVPLDANAWLAGLEAAGEVTVQWTCRPEAWDFERNCPKGQA
jgi:hypothetical protein